MSLSLKSIAADTAKAFTVSEKSFNCVTAMVPVRGFYVDNLTGNLEETLKVARSKKGGTYPVGSVVQLIPTEVMVKQAPGTNPATKDWEFFELNVSKEGTTINKRGFTDVINRFGGNCLSCHALAKPQWDLICETDHGCASIPLTHAMKWAMQRSDPRCSPANKLTAEDFDALRQLSNVLKPAN